MLTQTSADGCSPDVDRCVALDVSEKYYVILISFIEHILVSSGNIT